MNLGTYDATIDFSKLFVHNSTSIYFKEGDLNTARVRAKLTMQGKAIDITGCNIVVKIETMTGQKIDDVATIIDATNGIVEIDFKSNTLIEGTNFFELKIIKGESVKKSPKLAYRVLDSIEDAGSIEATNEYPILIQLINDTNKAIEDANEALELANTMKTNLEEVIDNANSAISNATDATNNANTAATNATSKITEVDNAKNDMTTKVDESIDTMKSEVSVAKNDMKITVDEAIKFLKQEFNSLTAQQQEELELLQARDGEVNLNARLKRDLYIGEKSLKQEVLDLCGLKEVQEITYDSTTVPNYNGSMVCKETKNGTVKDLKVKGKSLVNIALDSSKVSLKANPNGWRSQNINHDLFQVGKNYVLKVFNISEVESPHMYLLRLHYTDNTVQTVLHGSELINGVREKEFTIQKEINYIQCATNLFTKDFSCDIVIVNSDDSKYVNDYFEGIASVGNGTDKIEVSSCNTNILDVENLLKLSNGYTYDNGIYTIISNTKMYSDGYKINKFNSLTFACKVKIVDKMTNFRLRFVYTDGTFDESNATSSTSEFVQLTLTSAKGKIVDKIACNWTIPGTFQAKNWQLTLTDSYAGDIERKQDKKPLLFKDTDGNWKPIHKLCGKWENGKQLWGDVVDSVKGKWHNRCNEYVINGNESGLIINTTFTNENNITVQFRLEGAKYLSDIISDKLNVVKINGQNIGLSIAYNDYIYITMPKSIVGNDLQSVKTYLQTNNITVIYQLAEEKVFEVNPLFLEAYEGETMALINSGVVNAPIEFKITSYITNLVLLNQQRISILEQEMFSMFKQVLSGDMYSLAERLYPEDFIEEKHIATPIPEL